MKTLATTVGFLLVMQSAMAAVAEEKALDEALKKRAAQALTAHARLLKEILDEQIVKLKLDVRKSDKFPLAKLEKATLNKARLKVGDKLECRIRSSAKIPDPKQFAMIGVILTPGGDSSAGSGGGVALKGKYTVRVDQSVKMKTPGTHEVLFVLGVIRLADRQIRVLDAVVKKVTVIK